MANVDVIPAGASAVISDGNRGERERWVELMEAIKDAQANDVEVTKDAEAHLTELVKDAEADGVRTTKDSEANLERSLSASTQNIIQDVKDAETRLNGAMGDRFMQVVQDVKDAETRLSTTSDNHFIQTIEDVKNAAKDVALSGAHSVEVTKDVEFQLEKSQAHTRERIDTKVHGLEVEMLKQFKANEIETFKQYKSSEVEMLRQFESAQRRTYESDLRNLGQFKDQALLSERLAGHQALLSEKLAAAAAAKAAECCCEIKEKIGADGQKTRDLLNSITEQNLRDRAAKAEAALAAAFSAKVAPPTPVV